MSLTKLGRYDLIRVLGKGAMGLVYEGHDPNLRRRVAIKTIKVENLSAEAAAEYEMRFRTEARSAARLQHPNIVSVYDSDRDGDIAFLVMEFIQGDDLKHHLDKGERHTLEQTLAIMGDLLAALDYAHRQNIVHRDIKPANLLIEASGRVKLTDFGVARIQDSGDTTRTQGSMVGTLKYMSPEQVQGQPIDSRADLFAAGIVLYQLLTGKRPFDGDSDFAIIQQIVGQNPAAPSSFNRKLPGAMDAVVARALAKSRDQRFANGAEFASALKAAAGQAYDATAIAPPGSFGTAGSSTWTGTVRPSESLVDTPSGIGTSGSIVTQELELVYWKDVKESNDIEDLQGFLARFPNGIYTALARRRLRKLGGMSGDDSSMGSRSGVGPLDKTMLMPTDGSSGISKPVADKVDSAWDALGQAAEQASAPVPLEGGSRAGIEASPESISSTLPPIPATPLRQTEPASPALPAASPSSPADSPAPAPKRLVWVMAAVVAVVAAGLVFRQTTPSDAPPAQSATPSEPAALAASMPALPGSATTQAAQTLAPPPAASAAMVAAPGPAPATTSATPASTALASATPASAAALAAAAAKKAAADKERLAKQAPAKATTTATVVPEPSRTEQRAAPAPAANNNTSTSSLANGTAAHPPTPVAAAATPRQACEDRKLFGFQSCMAEQCAKPVFANNAECIERNAMEQRRRDAEQSRR